MKQNVLAPVFLVCLGTLAFAQEGRVGINTADPKTTMDVRGKTDLTGTSLSTDITGLQAPRLTRAELTAKGNTLYGTEQKGALVYITDVTGGDVASQRVNITTQGYYYFDGALWTKLNSGAIPATESWYNQATGTAATANTQNVYQTGRVATGFDNSLGYDFGHQLNVKGHISTKRWNSAPNLVQTRYNGTEAAPTAVLVDDQVGSISFEAFAGGGITGARPSVANISSWAAENTTASASAGKLVFATVPVATIIPTQRMTIDDKGNVGIGLPSVGSSPKPSNPTNTLHVKATTDPVRIEGLAAGAVTDNIVTVDANGVLKKSTASTANFWAVTGNAGTTAGTNFIGTTDATDVVFKRGNFFSGLIGQQNTSFGQNALESNQAASNTAFGKGALSSNVGGSPNSAFGNLAMLRNVNGIRNSAFGSEALLENLSDRNAAFGVQALTKNTTGFQNSAFGESAMFSNTTGYYNSSFGNGSLSSNTTGIRNNAFGFGAMTANTTGEQNSAFGESSLYSNLSGINNAAFGAGALSSVNSGNYNTGVGSAAGGNLTGAATNNTAIGYFTNLAVPAGSNQLNMANNIFGTGLTGSVTAPAGNIGIGIAAPTNTFHVKNSTGLDPVRIEGLVAGAATDNIVTVDANGVLKKSTSVVANNWTLAGNTGTTRGTNFIGTKDDKDLMFKTNGKYRMHINDHGGVVIGDSAQVYNVNMLNGNAGLRVQYRNDDVQGNLTANPPKPAFGIANILEANIKTGTSSTGSIRSLTTRLNLTAEAGGSKPSGDVAGASIYSFRGPITTALATDGAGTVAVMAGLNIFAGNGVGSVGPTSTFYGINVSPSNQGAGTITDFYGYYMGATNGTSGTITNKYGVYIDNLFTNYFKGNVGIGTAAGVATNQLHVKATSDPVRIEGLVAGAATDNIVTVDANGVLKKSTSTTADNLWIKNGTDKIQLTFAASKDDIFYADGFKQWDKSGTMADSFNSTTGAITQSDGKIGNVYNANFVRSTSIPDTKPTDISYSINSSNLVINSAETRTGKVYLNTVGIVNLGSTNAQDHSRLQGATYSAYHFGSGTVGIINGVSGRGAVYGNAKASQITGALGQTSLNSSGNIGVVNGVLSSPSVSQLQSGSINSLTGVRTGFDIHGSAAISTLAGNIVATNFSSYTGQITTYYDFYSPDLNPSNPITNKYGLYLLGAGKRSYLEGSLGIGTAAGVANAKLHVVKAAADLTPAIIEGCPVYADNAAAIAGLLPVGGIYRTSTGVLMVRF